MSKQEWRPMTWHSPPNWPPPPVGWVPPAGWQPDPAWGAAPPGWEFYRLPVTPRRAANKPVLIAVVLVAAVVFAIVAGNSSPDTAAPPSDPVTAGQAAPPVAAVVPADSDMTGAAAWISKTQSDTHSVQVAVQSVQAGIKLLQDGGSDPAATAELSGLVKQSQGFLHDAELNLVTEIDKPLKDQREEAWFAANELSDAMKKLRSYIDDQKPSELSDFQNKYQQGVRFWNEAVTKIWSTAGQPTPPTV